MAVARTENVKPPPAIDSKVFDEFRAIGAGPGANQFVNQIVAQYLAESTARIVTLKDAVTRGDALALRQAAHSLKGSAGTVGANRMADLCGELETLARGTTLDGSPALVAALDDEFARVGRELQAETDGPGGRK
jgi:HPt (histidine-containing phosphotransfer) domain-containing protein